MIEAAAGCAKTSTLAMAAPKVRGFSLALAFNKKIAEDMAGALPSSFEVKTMNALGHRAWVSQASSPIKLEPKKLPKLVSEVSREFKLGLDTDQWEELRGLVSAAMAAGLVPSSQQGAKETLVPDTRAGWLAIAESINLWQEDFDLLWEPARAVLERDIILAKQGIISFDDQIYCPVMLGGKFDTFANVFVDEDQDLSNLQIEMLSRVIRPGSRIVACGDSRQAIYAWRGASGQAASLIRRLRLHWQDFPLLTTFRCPRVIVTRQQEHVPGFRAWSGAAEGEVVNFKLGGWTIQEILACNPSSNQPIAILCRNNAPLLSLGFKLMRQGISISMAGRDIGKGLVSLVKKICGKTDPSKVKASIFLGLLDDWASREKSKALAEDRPERVSSIIDRTEAIQVTAEGIEAQDAGQIISQLEALFSRPQGTQILLSSIHRAKGLEWPLVVHLDPWRLPSKQALRAAKEGNSVPLQQEKNLLYVCETRTKHTLVNANLADFY